MRFKINSIVAGLGVTVLAALGLLVPAAAQAESAPCMAQAAGDCGSQVNHFGYAFTVTGTPAVGEKVTGTLDNATGDTDWNAVQTTKFADERVFFFAPGGTDVLVGGKPLVLSQLNGSHNLVLRKYTGSQNQRFVGVNTRNSCGTTWTNVASGDRVEGNGAGNALVAFGVATNTAGSIYGFGAPGCLPAS
jgi:hypothetical protein